MPTTNLFAQGFTNAVYEAEFINRKMNLGGALHTLASRGKMQHLLDTYDASAPVGVGQAALRGALLARNALSPLTICLDMLVGTGRTHFAPGERAEAAEGVSTVAHEIAIFKADFKNLLRHGHPERVEWLKNRAGQSLEHPCDTGLIGVVAGASSLPMLFVVSAIGATVGAAVGSLAFAVQKAAGVKDITFIDTVNNVSSWFSGVPTMLIRGFVPAMSVSFNIATRVGQLSFDVGNLVPMYLLLQSSRIATAGLKVGISAVGAALGALVGLGLVATRAFATAPKGAVAQAVEDKVEAKVHITSLEPAEPSVVEDSVPTPQVDTHDVDLDVLHSARLGPAIAY